MSKSLMTSTYDIRLVYSVKKSLKSTVRKTNGACNNATNNVTTNTLIPGASVTLSRWLCFACLLVWSVLHFYANESLYYNPELNFHERHPSQEFIPK